MQYVMDHWSLVVHSLRSGRGAVLASCFVVQSQFIQGTFGHFCGEHQVHVQLVSKRRQPFTSHLFTYVFVVVVRWCLAEQYTVSHFMD